MNDLHFSSVFTPLQGKIVNIPLPERQGKGGGMTSWGSYLVVITHEGKIYFVDQDYTVTQSGIEAPFNGFDDYVAAAAKPPFDKLDHNFANFRYNDISYFKSNERQGFLVSYTKYDKVNACYTNAISRLYVDDTSDDIINYEISSNLWTDIYQTSPCLPLKQEWRAIEGHMAGGRIAFDGEKTVYLSSGDYSWDGMYGPRTIPGTDPEKGPAVAQDPNADYGKVIAIDVITGDARQLSRGHRNMQGIIIDRNGRVWTVEHGARGGDELNLIVEGKNYGWPLESYGTLYSTMPLKNMNSYGWHKEFQRPSTAWLPSIAVSGLTRIEGFHEAWNGDLLASTLVGQKLVRIRVANNHVIFSENIEVGQTVRHIHQHNDGKIVLWTDNKQLIFISPAAGGAGLKYVNFRLDTLQASDEIANKVRSTIYSCMECHSFNSEENTKAPSLANIYHSKIGSTQFKGYSEALISDQRVWTRELMEEYLTDPQSMLPGTIMSNPNISDEIIRKEVIDILIGLATDIEIPPNYRD
ncbi:MAG: hypothetical protein HOH18_00495 [Kordiimonadaceae bacterium]|nr:hypothetical protein [Kordiimonadaceae bacterium]MBT6034929.1 hypothetical protein [Kordiimonadaceae bacterium]